IGRLNNIDILNEANGLRELNEIAKHHRITLPPSYDKVSWNLIKLGISYTNIIDFTDMVTMPIYKGYSAFQYDYVFIDECQDINKSQRTLMEKSIKEDGGRFVAVGDRRQAIYGFSGADH